MALSPADLFPVLGLRIAAGPLELRGIADDDVAVLAELALAGIHAPGEMPFAVPWTDAPPEELPLRFAQYHWGNRASFSRERWTLDFAVRWAGEVVGTQGFFTRDYLVTRSGETGSWLGAAHQGQGIGTAMRQAICAFLFDHLGAEVVHSGAFLDNPASLAVSRKVGYVENGRDRRQRRPGERAEYQALVLTPDRLVRGEPITVEGLAPVRRLIGLDGWVRLDAAAGPSDRGDRSMRRRGASVIGVADRNDAPGDPSGANDGRMEARSTLLIGAADQTPKESTW